jgi:hypothetical protein
MVQKLWGFKEFSLALVRLSATVNAAISAKIKISMYRRGTKVCFYCLNFQSKNFSYAIFIVKKRHVYVNFSIPPCGN